MLNSNLSKRFAGRVLQRGFVLGFFVILCAILLGGYLASPRQAAAANTGVRINEIMAGANGNSKIQFIELEVQSSAEKCWGPQTSGSACFVGTTESAGRAMLVFFDAAGNQTGRYVFPNDPGGTLNTVLAATQAFADQPGAPAPDFILPPEVMAIDGQACFRGNLDNPNASSVNLCLSYGAFSGPQQPNAAPGDPAGGPFSGPLNGLPLANPLPINAAFSIVRTEPGFGDHLNSNFVLTSTPGPQNSAGQTFSFPTANLEQVGENLFFQETFNGNGRTCGTCHTPQDSFGLSPATVAGLPATDPLFIAEYNLNTLTLAARSQPSDLRGTLTAGSGATVTVLAGTQTTYLVYGGSATLVGQIVTDSKGNSALVTSFTAGDLNQLENPTLMRNGRALILLNPDGFATPAAARTSPHLLNIQNTRPFGLSSSFDDLDVFSSHAVEQHNPRRVARVVGTDLRLPTGDELAAMVAFMNTINVPSDQNFSLDRLVTTAAQKRGRALFQSEFNDGFNCDTCHENQVLAAIDHFNTQVGKLPINDAQHDNLPRDSHEFSTAPLFGIRDTAPYFHDNSIATLREAVAFYGGIEFQTGPDAFLVNPAFFVNPQNIDDVVTFLEALVEPVTDFTRTVDFGSQQTAAGPTASQTITITNISSEPLTISGVVLNGTDSAQFNITAQPDGAPFGPGETRTIQAAFDPAATGIFAATLEFTAVKTSNGEAYAFGTALSGTGTNSPPTLSSLLDQVINEDIPSAALPLTVSDPESSAGSLTLSGLSSNPTLLPDANIVFGGAGGSRTVTLTPALDQNGTVSVTLTVSDGTASTSKTFTLTVNPVNDAPAFTPGPNQEASDIAGPQTVPGWASALSAGPPDEAGQFLSFALTTDSPALFSVPPALAPDGTLTYTPQPGTVGVAQVTAVLNDNGGSANGGVNSSSPAVFTISIGLNDPPTFTPGANQTRLEDAGAQVVTGWATNISAGPPDEAGQTLTFIVTHDNSALFSIQPAISSVGTLTFTPAANANGSALVTVTLKDNGGTANGGQDSSAPAIFTITITAVNDKPSFTPGATQSALEDAGPKTVTGWATAISAGAANESAQVLTFVITNNNTALFAVQPAIAANGTLTYTPAANRSGQATATVTLRDDGGTANGGQDASSPANFTIRVTAVNDAPSFTPGANQAVLETVGPQTVTGWATAISPGPTTSEAGQTLNFIVTNDQPGVFTVQPAIAANGTLTYTPNPSVNGSARVTVMLHDSGGVTNGGQDTSAPLIFTITIGINDPPSFIPGPSQNLLEDTGAQSITGWATAISAGPVNESGQVLTFIVTNDNNGLFAVQPAISSVGTLTFTPAADANGSAQATVVLKDDGGTLNGGQDTSAPAVFTIAITSINDAPAFASGPAQTVSEDAGSQVISGWATNISAGPANESGQVLTFNVTNDNPALFAVGPALAADGTLTYTPAAAASGVAQVTVTLHDNGGVANGGLDASAPLVFTLTVLSVNDAPSFIPGSAQNLLEDAGAQSIPAWATAISAGPANEAGQVLTFIVTNDNNGLFSVQPAIAANGTLSYTPAANANGSAQVTVSLKDDGGIANGGQDSSAPAVFSITISAVNDKPSFTPGATQSALEDAGLKTVTGWATAISAGAANEAGQALTFVVTNNNTVLFAVQPAIAADGTLTYTPAANRSGLATVTVTLRDDGGTANGGQDASSPVTFTIRVTAVNDAPSFTPGANQTVAKNSGAQTVAAWAKNISPGPSGETGQVVNFIVSSNNPGLFAVQPAISATGTLTYTPAAGLSGTATVTVSLHDNGGTANGGVDTSAPVTFTITITP